MTIWHITKDGKNTVCGVKSKDRINVTYKDWEVDEGKWCSDCQRLTGPRSEQARGIITTVEVTVSNGAACVCCGRKDLPLFEDYCCPECQKGRSFRR